MYIMGDDDDDDDDVKENETGPFHFNLGAYIASLKCLRNLFYLIYLRKKKK
jgi:hypothetical protein